MVSAEYRYNFVCVLASEGSVSHQSSAAIESQYSHGRSHILFVQRPRRLSVLEQSTCRLHQISATLQLVTLSRAIVRVAVGRKRVCCGCSSRNWPHVGPSPRARAGSTSGSGDAGTTQRPPQVTAGTRWSLGPAWTALPVNGWPRRTCSNCSTSTCSNVLNTLR